MRMGIALSLLLWLGVLCCLSACAVPALLGVKSYQSGDTKIDFITGADVGLSLNGIDSVSDSRGISPQGGYQNVKRGN